MMVVFWMYFGDLYISIGNDDSSCCRYIICILFIVISFNNVYKFGVFIVFFVGILIILYVMS